MKDSAVPCRIGCQRPCMVQVSTRVPRDASSGPVPDSCRCRSSCYWTASPFAESCVALAGYDKVSSGLPSVAVLCVVAQEQNLRTCDHVRVALAGLPQNVVVVVCYSLTWLAEVEDSHSNPLVTASPLPALTTSFVSVTFMMRTVESLLSDDLITAD